MLAPSHTIPISLPAGTSAIPKSTPTSLLGCAATSATIMPRACSSCKGMLAPRKFSSGSKHHICHEPNCAVHFTAAHSHFYQCLNCLNIICTKCRAGKPKRLGKLPNDYLVLKLRTTSTGEPIPASASAKSSVSNATKAQRKPLICIPSLIPSRPPGSSDDPLPQAAMTAGAQSIPLITSPVLQGSNLTPPDISGSPRNVPSPAPSPNVGRHRRSPATTTSGIPLQTDDGRSTQQTSMHHYFQTKVASGIAFMAMVTQGFMAQPPMQTFVTLPAAVNAFLAPPSLTLISSSAIPADIGDLANPSISPFSLRVLEQLRALPTFDSLTTLTYCPKGSSRRFGILYASAFWYQNLAMDCSILHQEFYSLLTFHLPMLILHDDRPLTQLPPGPEGPRPPDAAGSSEQVSTRTKVKERLALAEQGHWDILAQRLCAAHHELSQRPELSHTPPSFLKTCELACAKATGRCFRAAAQLLTAPTAPPTSVATFNLTKLLFPTLALETSQAREWDKALLRIKNLPLSTLPIITTKAVTHRLMRIRAGAQPGCSRSRKTHISHRFCWLPGEPKPCTAGHSDGPKGECLKLWHQFGR